jgi:hypothetical protein
MFIAACGSAAMPGIFAMVPVAGSWASAEKLRITTVTILSAAFCTDHPG